MTKMSSKDREEIPQHQGNVSFSEETPGLESQLKSLSRQGNILYLVMTGGFFLTLFIVFIFLPRPAYSELEKRELGGFPKFEEYKDNLAGYTADISNWFSNTQPHRDDFLTMSMNLRNSMKFNFRSDEDAVSFIATGDGMEEGMAGDVLVPMDFAETEVHDPESLKDENAKVGNAGVIVAGNAPNARAMMAFGGVPGSGSSFVSMANNYASTFPNVNLYAVIASGAGEFYMPEKVAGRNKPETPVLDHIKSGLAPGVKYVNVHDALEAHKGEDIFLRTDHHWAPLGAYYAAKAFAATAGVPFKNLDSYDRHVIKGYVGSMYGYSKDINVKNSPEDFVYYTPRGIDYKADFITYKTNSDFQITGTSGPYPSPFFKTFKDGSGGAYCTFMGSDQCTVHVSTGTKNGRKLLIIKDSFGNAVPGYLFYSFSDIYIVDFRYFNKNMKKYVADNGITDIAFILNIFNVCSGSSTLKINRFLTQGDGTLASETKEEKPKEAQKETPEAPESKPETSVGKGNSPEEEPSKAKEEPDKVKEEPGVQSPKEEPAPKPETPTPPMEE